MLDVQVKVDFRDARVYLRSLSTVQAEAARRLQAERALRIGEIKKQMRIDRATVQKLVARVSVSGKPISMRHFSRLRFDRTNGKVIGVTGISAKIRNEDRFKLLRRHGNKAFTNPKIGGGLAIVYRTTKKRLPISAWAPVPGLPRVLVQAKVMEALKALANDTFDKRLRHELEYEISRARGKTSREFGAITGTVGGRLVRAFR
jgi:hypothetical protein